MSDQPQNNEDQGFIALDAQQSAAALADENAYYRRQEALSQAVRWAGEFDYSPAKIVEAAQAFDTFLKGAE